MQKLVKLHQFVLKILSGNKIPTYIKGHNTVINLQKSMCNNPNLDVFNINAFAKSGQISSTISQDTEWKFGQIPSNAERGGSVVECRTPEREVRGSRPTAAVLCP